MAVGGLVLIARAVRRRAIGTVVLNVIVLAVNVGNAGFWWRLEGACLLPHPSLIEFRPGMTLCPGQSAPLLIELPVREKPGI